MPRAEPAGTTSPTAQSSSQPINHNLRRNKACHQCRRRKLKCDGQKPCSTCVKSHRFAIATNHALPDTEPECTFDEVNPDGTVPRRPRAKYTALEDRIGELEALLKGQLTKEPGSASQNPSASFDSTASTTSTLSNVDASTEPSPLVGLFGTPVDNTLDYLTEFLGDGNNSQTPPARVDFLFSQPSLPLNPPPQLIGYTPNASEQVSPEYQLISPDWPARLPQPNLLRHLVDTFFSCYNNAHYLLHRPTFMASLALSPRSPKFPHVALLHAICAYASIFSYLVDSPPMTDMERFTGDVIFGDRRNRRNGGTDTFSDQQIRWSKQARDEATSMGFNLKECTQAIMIEVGYYHLQGRWVELWMASGLVLRYCVPLSLNIGYGYHTDGILVDSIDDPDEACLLPTATDYVEREQRVHMFWVAYTNERFQTTAGAWAMGIDDEDVHQYLPVAVSYYETGQDVDLPRQTIRSPNVLLDHPPEITDSFTLYVKAAILVSKARALNLRIRRQHPNTKDIRELTEFQELERQAMLFRKSFPPGYLEPVIQSSKGLDTHLYAAHLVPHFTLLVLHDKLSDFNSPNCLSIQKATEAARASLDLIYAVCSTSYDITRLPPICGLCWYKTASYMVQILKFQVATGRHEEALVTDSEIKVIKSALTRMAERIPVGLRYRQMIDYEIQADNARTQMSISKQTAYSSRAPTPGWQTPTEREFPDRQAIWSNMQSVSSLREVNTLHARQILTSSTMNGLGGIAPPSGSLGAQAQVTDFLQGFEFDTFPPSSG
ncbi:hypothetical protein BDV93DRAFT_518584 [Ceratobasidium sp. AG-I]|nr:hypothetical protein BDV93DRAFT_518584 [Ceratobasidium sp. AG-I]